MRTSRIAWFGAIFVSTAAMAAPPTAELPRTLLLKSQIAGSGIDTAEIVDGTGYGLFDRGGGHALRVSRAAFDEAASAQERTALLAIALSYRLGMPRRVESGAARAGRFLAGMVAADIDESIDARDRADPYLKLPTASRRWAPLPTPYARPGVDPVAVRGLAWAKAAGVCERTSIALLTRLGSRRPANDPVAIDARAALTGLGSLRFGPDARCRDL